MVKMNTWSIFRFSWTTTRRRGSIRAFWRRCCLTSASATATPPAGIIPSAGKPRTRSIGHVSKWLSSLAPRRARLSLPAAPRKATTSLSAGSPACIGLKATISSRPLRSTRQFSTRANGFSAKALKLHSYPSTVSGACRPSKSLKRLPPRPSWSASWPPTMKWAPCSRSRKLPGSAKNTACSFTATPLRRPGKSPSTCKRPKDNAFQTFFIRSGKFRAMSVREESI